MKILGIRIAGAVAAGFLGLATIGQPAQLLAQNNAKIHGHVQNAAGMPLTTGEVKLTTDKNPSSSSAKWDFTFPLDGSGNFKGDVKAGSYIGGVFQQGKSVDFIPVTIAAGEDKALDFDMTRKEYIDKMSAADKEALEEYKKKNAEVSAANAKIGNLNNLLKQARDDTKAGNYDTAIKAMTDATTAKPDEPILWETLGDAQLGQANAAAKATGAKMTDPAVLDKFTAAGASYQKALALNAALAKPSRTPATTANNQLGQVLGKTGKTADSSSAYEAAAKADPPKAAYYFNEAATLFNANDMDGAAAAADKAIAADPTKVDAYYIKGQALVQKATVDEKTNKITAPPECIAAYNKYLELAPTGPHAEIKGILQESARRVQRATKPQHPQEEIAAVEGWKRPWAMRAWGAFFLGRGLGRGVLMSGANAEARILGFVEALDIVLRHAAEVRVPGSRRVALLTAAGRVLAEDVADRDQPPFDRATRDGFTVRAEVVCGQKLPVVGRGALAGEGWARGT